MRRSWSALFLVHLLLASACSGDVRVGSKAFTESVLLGEIACGLIADTGLVADHADEIGGSGLLWTALRAGVVDVYPEYTGTLKLEIFDGLDLPDDASLQQALAAEGVAMTRRLGFNNTYILGMRRQQAAELGIHKISDLRQHPQLRLGFTPEFMERADGWPGLQARYRLPQTSVHALNHDLAYRALEAGEIDVMDLYSTDAEIEFYKLQPLQDDLSYFPPYDAVFLYRADLGRRHPAAVASLRKLEGRLDERRMIALNGAVKNRDPARRHSERRVARDFLHASLNIHYQAPEQSRWERMWRGTFEHLLLTLASLGAAVLISVPLGIVASRNRILGQVILAATGILLTIPSLALLVLLIPLLGIGFRTAVVALFLYSLLPIVRNTFTGLSNIPVELRESAEALGLSQRSRLRKIDLPMALPQILAGIKISAVLNVGTATLAAFIAAGGLGDLILAGVRKVDQELMLMGAVPAALLALLVLWLFDLLERRLVSPGLRA